MNSDETVTIISENTGFAHHHPGGFVSNQKHAIILVPTTLAGIRPQAAASFRGIKACSDYFRLRFK